MSSEITPRANAPLLHLFQGKPVRLIGRVTEIRGETATLDAAGSVTVYATRDSNFKEGNVYEVIGRVQPDLSLKMLDGMDFGTNIDMDNANALAELSQRHHEIFFDK
ncbi:replication factor A protein 3 [Lipomyces orientalis]|uniref:Replication factor A protein 3 n=1 Tax=Lipomyces orientalis TaxID=1233043 RepID=A0ACC3TZ21_9ASCO